MSETRHEDLKLKSDAQCVHELTVDESLSKKPDEVRGPNILERASEEVAAVASSIKHAILRDQSKPTTNDNKPYKHS